MVPLDWEAPWITLINFGLFNSFRDNASRDISWKLSPKKINMAVNAKVLACSRRVKKEHTKIMMLMTSWDAIIQVFLFPYDIDEYFYKMGAVTNLNEKGIMHKENKLRVK